MLPPHVYQCLHERFGYQHFRPGQEAIIAALLAGEQALVVMPTGSGKSLCYQLPALCNAGCTVVISPLIALMQDQVEGLRARGIAATFVNSSLSAQEQHERLQACRAGAYRLLYVAPERFRNARFAQVMAQTRVALFVVDEAHCISEWGHDFRPDYLRLRQAIELLGAPQVLALTATATVEVQHDIQQHLGCGAMQRFVLGFDRPNLTYRVLTLNTPAAKLQAVADVLAVQPEGSRLVYAATRRTVEEVAAFLQARGHDVLLYHAGLADAARRRMQEAFMAQPGGVMVATNAFGMGVDKPDVRCVVHVNMPRSLEAYYQEAGRAGRDGLPAECLLLFSYGDVKIQEFLIEQSYPTRELMEEVYTGLVALNRQQPVVPLSALTATRRRGYSDAQIAASLKLLERAGYVERLLSYDTPEEVAQASVRLLGEPLPARQLRLDYGALERRKQHELHKLRRMVGYANAQQCRRRRLLEYFGEERQEPHCGACDYCRQEGTFDQAAQPPARPPSEAEWLTIQKILSCVARMRGAYGRAKVMQVLMGAQTKDLRETSLTRLSTYGILKGTPRPVIEAYLDALLAANCLQVLGEEFPRLGLTPHGQAVMRRQQSVQLALPETSSRRVVAPPRNIRPPEAIPTLTPEAVRPAPRGKPASTEAASAPARTIYDPALFESLKAERTALARAAALPPYCVCNDQTLRDLATQLPTDHTALLRIHGIGQAKVSKYGERFLNLIRRHLAQQAGHSTTTSPADPAP